MYKEFTAASITKVESKHKSVPLYLTNKGMVSGKEQTDVQTTFTITDTEGCVYTQIFYKKNSIGTQRIKPYQVVRCWVRDNRITAVYPKDDFEKRISAKIAALQTENHNNTLEMESLKLLLKEKVAA